MDNNDQPRPLDEQPNQELTPPAYQPNTQPITQKPFTADSATAVFPKKSNKKRNIILVSIIAAVLVILGGGGAFAYQFWYQNPEKVMADGVMNALKAKTATFTGTVSGTSDGQKIKLEIDGAGDRSKGNVNVKATFDIEGKPVTLTGSGLMDGEGALYLKVKNVKEIIAPYYAMISRESQATLDKLITKIDDRWIKISIDDMKDFSEDYAKSQKCASDTLKKFQNDKTAINEVADLYKKNKFLKIDQNLGMKDGSLGYTVSANTEAMKGFSKDLKNTKIYKDLQSCDSSAAEESDDAIKPDETDRETHVEVWVSQWTHEITKITAKGGTGTDVANLELKPVFNKPVTITAPEKSMTLSELKTEIESLTQSLYGSMAVPEASGQEV